MQWENHRKSLELEQEMLKKINERIEEKVTQGEGTWIDWQYLKDAATHLTKVKIHIVVDSSKLLLIAMTVPIHSKIYLPICLLHGREQKAFSELRMHFCCLL